MDWYYAKDEQQQGPVSKEALLDLLKNGEISEATLVWNESMTNWAAIGTIPELSAASDAPAEEAPSGLEPNPTPAAPAEASPTLTPAAAAAPAAAASAAPGEKVPTYLWQSIVCLVLCCLPAAIPAIIFATKVEPALKSGDIDAAQEASKKAKMWCIISFCVGLVVQVVFFIIGVAGGLAEANAY